jgi:nucleotide-binding universal stress UspA family protein
MFAKILVPLDGSAFAERALATAERLALSSGADICLVRVVDLLAPGEHEPGVVSYLDEHRIAVAQEYVTRTAARLRLGRLVSAEAYIAADVPAGILARAADAGVDLIVMTTHGASWPAEGALGSVASRLTREAACPLLVIGPHAVQDTVTVRDTEEAGARSV